MNLKVIIINPYMIIGKKYNASNLNSENAAFDAASKICIKYEVPSEKEKKAIERGNTAKQIYLIMTG